MELKEANDLHKEICNQIRKSKGKKRATEFDIEYNKIKKNQGLEKALEHQKKVIAELGLTEPPVTPVIIDLEGDKVKISVNEREPF